MKPGHALLLLAVALAAVCGSHAAGRGTGPAGPSPSELEPRIASDYQIGTAFSLERPGTGAPSDPTPETEQGQRRALLALKWHYSLLDLVNAARRKRGLRPLCLNAKLIAAAQAHANDQAAMRRMSHTGSDGSKVWHRVQRRGYSWFFVAENVAYGYPSVQDVFRAWMNSSGHYANIMNPNAKHMGAGFNNRGNYWAQVFGGSSSDGCSS